MSEENQAAQPAQQQAPQIDPAFFTCVNEFLGLANEQAKKHGPRRISLATLHATARFNAYAFLYEMDTKAADQRKTFLDYMTDLYRRLLNDHLDTIGAVRGIDVGESELAEEYKANGYVPGKGFLGAAED